MFEPQIKSVAPMTVAYTAMRGAYEQIPAAMGDSTHGSQAWA